jgi:endonuclease YncB( thermonuclease family)
MRGSPIVHSSRRSVAFALAGALAFISIPLLAGELAHSAETLAGRATVIDGDTISIGGTHVRLEGIDAPEASQTCARKWIGSWSCGAAATKELSRLVAGRRVDCEAQGHDKYGRMLGICFVDGRDINAELVRSGLAWAFVKYSTSYVEAEGEARALKIGIWQAETEPAWVYREKRWQSAETGAPNGCAIKGNVTAKGNIYHMPWSPWYGKVRIEAAKGERWFCSEAEARQAGWRPAMVH